MAGYYFIKSNGHLFRLTKKGYHTWIADSTNRLAQNLLPAKLKHYGTDLGQIDDIKAVKDFEIADFVKLNQLYSSIDTETDV